MEHKEVKVGDIIKSYDFPPATHSYFIGKVVEVKGEFTHCDTLKIIREGEEIDVSNASDFRTPKMGCMVDDHEFERIEVLG